MSNNSELSVWRCGLRAEKLFEKICPLEWHNLKLTSKQSVRFCENCEKSVYEVKSPEEFVQRSKNRECVAINIKLQAKDQTEKWLGQPMPWNYVTDANARAWWEKVRDLGDGSTRRTIRKDIGDMDAHLYFQKKVFQEPE